MTATDDSLKHDARYSEALNHLQAGRWSEAMKVLEELQRLHPEEPDVVSLLKQAQLKASLEQDWSGRIKTRRVSISAKRVAVRVALGVLVVFVAYAGVNLYRQLYVPRKAAVTVQAQGVELREQARLELAQGNYEEAQLAFTQLLEITPGDSEAAAGLAESERQIQLAVDYEAAMAAVSDGDTENAKVRLLDIQSRMPGYLDVAKQLEALENVFHPEELFAEAEELYAAGRWPEAAAAYEALREKSAVYEQSVVEAHLFDSYMAYGQALVSKLPADNETVAQAQQAFRRALSLRPKEAQATKEQELTYVYASGVGLFEAGEWEQASTLLRSVYDQRPDYLGGHLAALLYRTYLSLGDLSMSSGEGLQARDHYERAARLDVDDVSEAVVRLNGLIPGLTPTATATPSPTPSPTPTSTATPGPTPLPTATPEPVPLWYHAGWIAFLSDRDGESGLYVMRSDGSSVTQLYGLDLVVYDAMLDMQRRSPDGKARVYAESEGGASEATDLFIFRDDLPSDWIRRWVLVDHGKNCYDPVWSPDGQKVAYVSQLTQNDEIWVVNADGSDDTQLTFNDWEWDKSPTWSPDGTKIAFWSNRGTGHKQIWVMNADGTEQHNISNNEFDDWQPVWISPALVSRAAEAIAAAEKERAAARATSEAMRAVTIRPTATVIPEPTASEK